MFPLPAVEEDTCFDRYWNDKNDKQEQYAVHDPKWSSWDVVNNTRSRQNWVTEIIAAQRNIVDVCGDFFLFTCQIDFNKCWYLSWGVSKRPILTQSGVCDCSFFTRTSCDHVANRCHVQLIKAQQICSFASLRQVRLNLVLFISPLIQSLFTAAGYVL